MNCQNDANERLVAGLRKVFPNGAMLSGMRPPLLTEEAIRAAIRELSVSGGRVTGVAVRRLLAARHGARGGVTRIYRLVREAQRVIPHVSPARPVPAVRSNDTREAAIARAELAEHRERVHQERWARDTDELRRRLQEAEREAAEAGEARRRLAELRRALATAQARIAALEREVAERPK
jgi:hypothetical protein